MRKVPVRRRASLGNPLARFKILLNADYMRLWSIGVSASTVLWLETVALGVYVYELTGSAFVVGFIGFLRLMPLLLLGAFIGTIADRANRRLMLAAANITLALVYLTLGLLVLLDRIELWHIAAGALIGGMLWATDFPVRRAMIADTVPPDRMSAAFGVDMASSNFARVIGPLVGGVFLQTIGMQGVYFLGSALFRDIVAARHLNAVRKDRPHRNRFYTIARKHRNLRSTERIAACKGRFRVVRHHHRHDRDERVRVPLSTDDPSDRH